MNKKFLLKEICARSVNRNFYIDETILNHFSVEILKEFYEKEPVLFRNFFKSTFVICLRDTKENILKKVNKRIAEGKEHAENYLKYTDEENLVKIEKSIEDFKKRVEFFETCMNVFEINASLPMSVKVKNCKRKIKNFSKSLSKSAFKPF